MNNGNCPRNAFLLVLALVVASPICAEDRQAEVCELVRSNRLMRAAEVARYYAEDTLESTRTYDPVWSPVATELSSAAQYSHDSRFRAFYRARAASALDMHREAVKYYRMAIDLSDSKMDRAQYSHAAAVDALRIQDYELAAKMYDLVALYGATWVKEMGVHRAEAIRGFAAHVNDATHRLEFVQAVWIGESPGEGQYYDDAVRFLTRTLEMCRDIPVQQRKQVHQLALDYCVKGNDLASARQWLEKISKSFPDDREFVASATVSLGAAMHKGGDKEQAYDFFHTVSKNFEGTKAWPDAEYNMALIKQRRREFISAIKSYQKILDKDVNNKAVGSNIMSPYKNYQHQASLGIVRCYTALGRFDDALRMLDLASTKYRHESWCGTCSQSASAKRKAHRIFIKKLRDLPEPTDDTIATVAVEFLSNSHNEEAQWLLVAMGTKAVPVLARALARDDARVLAAADLLRSIGPAATDASERLVPLLEHDNQYVRATAAQALRAIGVEAQHVIPQLLGLLDKAVVALGSERTRSTGPGGAPLVPDVITFMRRPRVRALLSLVTTIGVTPTQHMELLRERLKGTNAAMQTAILEIIRSMGPGAAPLVPDVIAFIRHPGKGSPYSGSRALRVIGDPAVGPIIDAFSEVGINKEALAQGVGAKTLTKIQIKAFRALAATEDTSTCTHAMSVLVRYAPTTLPQLVSLLSDKQPHVREIALRMIRRARGRESITDTLVTMARDDSSTRVRSIAVLEIAGDEAFPALRRVRVVISALADDEHNVRNAGLNAVRSLGPDVPRVIPAMKRLAASGKNGDKPHRIMRELGYLK